jgi:hypothetical protein
VLTQFVKRPLAKRAFCRGSLICLVDSAVHDALRSGTSGYLMRELYLEGAIPDGDIRYGLCYG